MAAVSTIAIIGAVTSAVGTVAGIISSVKAGRSRKKAAAARREANAVRSASQENVDRRNRRQAIRSERVRRAQILQGAIGIGASGSSASIATPGIIGTGTASAIASQAGGAKAAKGISSLSQTAADLDSKASSAIAQGQLFSSVATGVNKAVIAIDKFDLFKSDTKKT